MKSSIYFCCQCGSSSAFQVGCCTICNHYTCASCPTEYDAVRDYGSSDYSSKPPQSTFDRSKPEPSESRTSTPHERDNDLFSEDSWEDVADLFEAANLRDHEEEKGEEVAAIGLQEDRQRNNTIPEASFESTVATEEAEGSRDVLGRNEAVDNGLQNRRNEEDNEPPSTQDEVTTQLSYVGPRTSRSSSLATLSALTPENTELNASLQSEREAGIDGQAVLSGPVQKSTLLPPPRGQQEAFPRPDAFESSPRLWPADVQESVPPLESESTMSIPTITIDHAPPSRQESFDTRPFKRNRSGALSPPPDPLLETNNLYNDYSDFNDNQGDLLDPIVGREYLLNLADPSRDASGPKDKPKHPATFQCSLCPKRFTRAYNLRSHLRTHTDERPFVCSICGKAFALQHDRKRHEGLHSGEKKFVCRGNLKEGGTWGCGRRFARAAALGRHFRSEAGEVCIRPLFAEEALERPPTVPLRLEIPHSSHDVATPATPRNLPKVLLLQYPALVNFDWTDDQREADLSDADQFIFTDFVNQEIETENLINSLNRSEDEHSGPTFGLNQTSAWASDIDVRDRYHQGVEQIGHLLLNESMEPTSLPDGSSQATIRDPAVTHVEVRTGTWSTLPGTVGDQLDDDTASDDSSDDTASSLLSPASWADQASLTNPTSASLGLPVQRATDSSSHVSGKAMSDAHEESFHEFDELESVVSIDDDIESKADSRAPGLVTYRPIAVRYFINILTKETELSELYQTATLRTRQDKFVRSHRRLLKRLFLDLNADKVLPSQRLALDFLKSRKHRDQVSVGIYQAFIEDDDKLEHRLDSLTGKEDMDRFSMLSRFLEDLDTALEPDLFESNSAATAESGVDNDNREGRTTTYQHNKGGQADDKDHEPHECEDDQDSDSSSEAGDGLDVAALSKLHETGGFITSGEAFTCFKGSLRKFLYADLKDLSDKDQGLNTLGTPEERSLNLDYDILQIQDDVSLPLNALKRRAELFAGSKLSWWPMSDPLREIESGHVRVFSRPCRCSWLHDDISSDLAYRLFPRLKDTKVQLTDARSSSLRVSVRLHDATLMEVILRFYGISNERGDIRMANSGNTTSNANSGAPPAASPKPVQSSSSSHSSQSATTIGAVSPTTTLAGSTLASSHSPAGVDPVLLLSIKADSNQTIARAIQLGTDDKTSFRNVRRAYQSLCRKWFRVKKITGIKFYRFDSFLYKQGLDIHHIQLHKDRERYPTETEPEYEEYRYRPQPWPSDAPFPTSQVWHYLNHPEDCGTSGAAMDMLPIRIKGPIASQKRAFGMHLEERYSIWAILLPSLILALLVLVPTGWFIADWLRSHPNDLQNAVVPMTIAVSILTLVLNMLISLLMFRWTVSDAG